MTWRPLAICPDPELREPLRAALADLQGIELKSYVAAELALETARRHGANVCFVEAASDPEKASAVIQALSEAGLPVIVVDAREDGPSILRCLRMGAVDFLIPPFSGGAVERALERLAGRPAPSEKRPASKVFCIVPGKGSCGATTLAVSLAVRLAELATGKVLLADFDLLTGGIGFHLNLKPTFTAVDALGDWSQLDEALWSRLVTPRHGIDTLLAPEDPVRLIPDPRRMAALMDLWRKRYGISLVDCPSASSELTACATRLADQNLVVTTNEIAALHATRRTIASLEQNGAGGDRLQVIVSRYGPRVGLDRATIEKALHRPVFALLPNDFAGVQQRLLEGSLAGPASEFGRAVAELARRLSGVAAAPAPAIGGGVATIFKNLLNRSHARPI